MNESACAALDLDNLVKRRVGQAREKRNAVGDQLDAPDAGRTRFGSASRWRASHPSAAGSSLTSALAAVIAKQPVMNLCQPISPTIADYAVRARQLKSCDQRSIDLGSEFDAAP